tara:strand:+ start:164 stop:748 length:585 start_codon:yes stop_codon:yes gene_type:complete
MEPHKIIKYVGYDYPYSGKSQLDLYKYVTSNCEHEVPMKGRRTETICNDYGNEWDTGLEELDNLLVWIENQAVFAVNLMSHCTESMYCNEKTRPDSFKIVETWGMYYPKGSGTLKHSHFPFPISFAYYINAPKGSSPFTLEGEDIPVRAGKILYFKGDAMHEVKPSGVDGRCMLTGNIVYVPKQTLDKSSETVV